MYQDASNIMRKAYDWQHSRISVLEVEAIPRVVFNKARFEVEVEVKFQLTVSRPVRHPFGTHDQLLFLLEILFGCGFVIL
jgi:hypothetical protein